MADPEPRQSGRTATGDGLVDGAGHRRRRQIGDHALDLPPVAEAYDIADIATAIGANGGFQAGVVAEPFHQVGGVGQHRAAGDEKLFHATGINPAALSRLRTIIVNGAFTIAFALEKPGPTCHGSGMQQRNPMAGGFLLTLFIVVGFGWGIFAGQPLVGALGGTAVGLVAAILVWLIDRRR